MEKENFFSYEDMLFASLIKNCWEWSYVQKIGKKIVSVKSSILRDFWDTGMSRNLHEMHEMYWVFIFDQR